MTELEEVNKIISMILPPNEKLENYPSSFRHKLPHMALTELRHQKRMKAKDPIAASAKAIMSDFNKIKQDFFNAIKKVNGNK